MQGFHPQKHKARPKNYANGGIVKGPGTGTSDSVPAMVPEDGYIMPADSTKALGFKPGMRAAQLSAGEAVLNPQQVQAAGGFQALDAMKNATHTPVPEHGAEGPKFFFANGGATDEERRKMLEQIPNSAPPGWTGGTGERVTGNDFTRNVSNTVNALAPVSGAAAPIVAGVARGFSGGAKAAAASPVLEKVAAYGVPAAGFGALAMASNDKPATEQAPGVTPPAGRAIPAVRPSADSIASGQPEKPGTPAAQANAQAAGNVSVRRQPNGVLEFSGENVAGDVSYSGASGFRPRGGTVSAQNNQAAEQLAARSGGGYSMRDDSGQAGSSGQAAPGAGMYVAPDTGGYGLMDKNRLRERELRMATTSTKSNLESSAGYKARMAAAAQALANFQDEQTNGPRNAAERDLKSQELALRGQEMQDARGFRAGQLANDSARTELEGQRVRSELEARGMEVGQAKQMQDLRSEYLNAKTDAERNSAAQKLQAMAGKPQDQQNRYTVVPGGQEWDATAGVMRNVPARVLNNQTGQFVDGGQQSSQGGPKPIKSQAERDALPKGTVYIGPDGITRTKS